MIVPPVEQAVEVQIEVCDAVCRGEVLVDVWWRCLTTTEGCPVKRLDKDTGASKRAANGSGREREKERKRGREGGRNVRGGRRGAVSETQVECGRARETQTAM